MSLAKPGVVAGPSPRFYTLITFVVVVAVLRITQEVTIPIALALLLAFLLSPLVVRLMRLGLPKALAITLTVILGFSALISGGWLLTKQAVSLLDELPRYETNIHKKIEDLKKPKGATSLSRTYLTIEKMWTDLQETAKEATPTPEEKPPTEAAKGAGNQPAGPAPAPVPVEVHQAGRSPLEIMRDAVGALFQPLSTAGIVAVFVIAILFQREDLRSRFIRVISGGQLSVATEAVDDASQRVSKYLLAQLMVNTCFGLTVGTGLYFIGIPHAPLWGLLATFLRFIPFLGILIAVVFPLSLSIAVDPGWSKLLWTLGLFVASEVTTVNLIEVLLYGGRTGISTLALLIAAVFWSWLWGIPGLFLSTPITVCLVVVGQYVPGLQFLGVLLGSEPPMRPAAAFYQRMLSMDQEEMFSFAERFVADRSLTEFYDDVFVPALLMAENDRHNGQLAEVRQKFIIEASRELIEELCQEVDEDSADDSHTPFSPRGTAAPEGGDDVSAVLLPARDEADELVALMLAHMLYVHGLRAAVTSVTQEPEAVANLLRASSRPVLISALPPSTLSAAARATRHVKHIRPKARVFIGLWSSEAEIDKLRHRLEPAGAEAVVTRLSDAVRLLQTALAPQAVNLAGKVIEATPTRHAPALKPAEAIDTVSRELAREFEVPIALVSVQQVDRAFWRPANGESTGAPFASPFSPDEADSVLITETPLVVEDLSKDERLSTHPLAVKRGVRFLATTPLRTRAGHYVGNLCVLDTQPREFGEDATGRLAELGEELMGLVEPASDGTGEKT